MVVRAGEIGSTSVILTECHDMVVAVGPEKRERRGPAWSTDVLAITGSGTSRETGDERIGSEANPIVCGTTNPNGDTILEADDGIGRFATTDTTVRSDTVAVV